MTLDQFITKYNGRGVNWDNAYGNQCVDLYRQYVKEVCNVPQSPSVAGAKDIWNTYLSQYFDRIGNTPTGVPQAGDIVIWGTKIGAYGHIAIFLDGNTSKFNSFDQNWPDTGGKGVAHKQSHTYNGVLGWLRLKVATPPPAPPTPPPAPPAPPPPPAPPSDPCANVRADLTDCQTKLTNTEKQLTDANAVAVELEGQLQLMTTRVVTAENEVKIIDTALKDLKTAYDESDRKLTTCNSDLLACDSKPPTVIVKPAEEMSGVEHLLAGFRKLFRKETKND